MYGGKINKVVSSSKKSSQLADIAYVELSGAVGKNICENKRGNSLGGLPPSAKGN